MSVFSVPVLHSVRYPRKPRGISAVLDTSYETRLSFCCATEGCRRQTTPPSIRFLGREVYLGVIIILVTALEQGLTPRRRKQLIEQLDLYPQTLSRWRKLKTALLDRFYASLCDATGSRESLQQTSKLLERLLQSAGELHNTYQSIDLLALQSLALEKLGRADEAVLKAAEIAAASCVAVQSDSKYS